LKRILATGLAAVLVLGACSSPPKGTVHDPGSSRPGSGQTDGTREEAPGTVRSDEPAATGHAAVDWARARIGAPYQWGGTGSGGFDCSGLVQAAYSRLGVRLPRTTRDQAKRGQMIARDAIRPGDLVFFGDSPKKINHVGIASGRDRMVHASSSRGVVEESFHDNNYFRSRYVFARRVTTQTASR
jgi:cell wall-associated NlpC family hydrolase